MSLRRHSLALAALALAACRPAPLPELFQRTSGEIRLPAGIFELASGIRIPPGAHDLVVTGSPEGTILRAADNFEDRALLYVENAERITIRNLRIDGNRAALSRERDLPPSDVRFIDFHDANGIAADEVQGLTLEDIEFTEVAGFAVLVARSTEVAVRRVSVRNSGSRNPRGKNNTTGGVLIEDGTCGFTVEDSVFENIDGNAVWTHSRYTAPRNCDGLIRANRFRLIGRDAIQIGHATRIRVEENSGEQIGFPPEVVDVAGGAIPVAIDTSGNVDHAVYARNRFEEINGKCIDLDGFHHGEVVGNTCINRGRAADYPFAGYAVVMNNTNPDMQSEGILIRDNLVDGSKFGGVFVIGHDNVVSGNRLLNLNKAGCNENAALYGCLHFPGEPDLLQSGIYLGKRAERPAPARDNVIKGNVITGYKMSERCLGFAPGIRPADNRIGPNDCRDAPAQP
ncbi:MAG TPA: right-handed parallel beta-helix repeat-containing protein [Bryobacterales bacterium]|nr:right-handed parallel beta-helix repeat-containing protein [Bryobacterales bacterium]